jgi:hypothetical protein
MAALLSELPSTLKGPTLLHIFAALTPLITLSALCPKITATNDINMVLNTISMTASPTLMQVHPIFLYSSGEFLV